MREKDDENLEELSILGNKLSNNYRANLSAQ